MTIGLRELAGFGWSQHFQSQLGADEHDSFVPVRVVAVHRNRLDVANPAFEASVPSFAPGGDEEGAATIGDWLLLERETRCFARLLERKSLFKRKAAGIERRMQLIAANIDTLLIVTSCNEEFNVARLERYLALARAAGVTPVVALTKADLAEDRAPFVSQALKLMPGLVVENIDARDPASADALRPWCAAGQTLALVGSSGVGKSTLVNTFLTGAVQATAGIREHDSHGRHTTTGRSLHRLQAGGWLLDTPGIRELQLANSEEGVE
ncbi:MAG: GTPase RsgA, partial [Pseudomonadota bacterium]|nr:GTPase RsgA [Pseudomonadota bacterium]